jgi:PadR family transcriptional regulator PadR
MPTTLSPTEVLTLVSVARLGDTAYGVTIRQDIHDCTARGVSLAAVYAALDRLERQGLVRPWLSEPRPERGGRARRHYALTAAGQAVVRVERANAARMWRGVSLEPTRHRR